MGAAAKPIAGAAVGVGVGVATGNPALGVMVGSSLIGAGAAYDQASAQREASEYQAAVERRNAELAETQAKDAVERGKLAASNLQRQLAQARSAQRVQLAATGVDIGSGSALDLQGDMWALGDLDLLAVRQNAEREAYGYRIGAAGNMAQSEMAKAAARQASPSLSAFNSLVGTATPYALSWYANKKAVE